MNNSKMNLLLFMALAISVSCKKMGNSNIYFEEFKKNEPQIYKAKNKAILEINNLNNSLMAHYEKAHYYPLYAIAADEAQIHYSRDSVLLALSIYFNKIEDTYNYARSLMYVGMSRYNINKYDTSVYYYLKQAERLFDFYKIDDSICRSRIYYSLGLIKMNNRNFDEAESYFLNALDIEKKRGKIINEQNIKIDLFWTYLARGQKSKAINSLIDFEDILPISPNIQFRLYDALSGYYSSKKEYTMSIEYLKKMLSLIENKHIIEDVSKLYHSLSLYYRRIGDLNEALKYGKNAIISNIDSTSLETHSYYKFLAKIYSQKGDYINAFKYLSSAHRLYVKNDSRVQRNISLEIEKKYDTTIIKSNLDTALKTKRILLQCFPIILSILIFSLCSLIRIHLKRTKETQKYMLNLQFYQKKVKKLYLMNEILQISNDIVPEVDNLYNLSHKARINFNEVIKILTESQVTIRNITERKISQITSDEHFDSENKLNNYVGLSDLEKMILRLIDYEISIKEIAKILNSTVPRINAIKHKAFKKRRI